MTNKNQLSSPAPKAWPKASLGEIGRWFGGGTPSKSNAAYWTNGTIPWVSPKDMKQPLIDDAQDHITEKAVRESSTNIVEAGSVLVVARSGILQHTLPVAITTRPVALNQDIKAIKPNKGVTPEFLAMALKAFEREILHTCTKTGTTVQSLELPVFHRFQIPVPPLTEQRRIVAEIEQQFTRLDAGVAALRRTQANLKRYRAAVLKAACEGRLVPTEAQHHRSEGKSKKLETGSELLSRILVERRQNWQSDGQYKEPARPEAADLPSLPEGWTWARAEQLCDFITKGTTPSAEKMQSGQGEIPFLKVYNLTFTGILNSDYKPVFISRKTHEADLARSKIRPRDILINIVGPPLGQISIVPDTITEANINQAIARFRVVLPECGKLLGIWLGAEPIIKWAMKRAKTTAGQTNLTLQHCRDLPIPLPPLAEQTRIVAEVERRLSVVDELESVVKTNLKRATRLRQSILQREFAQPDSKASIISI